MSSGDKTLHVVMVILTELRELATHLKRLETEIKAIKKELDNHRQDRLSDK
jgi:uncharacterized protein (UPF0335 family)